MSDVLSLVVLRDRIVIEAVVLSQKAGCVKEILPPRAPDVESKEFKLWIAAPDRRANLVKRVDAMLDKHGTPRDMTHGFFGLMGVAQRWIEDVSVEIGLCLKAEEIRVGESLGG